MTTDLSEDVVETAVELTRRARNARDDEEAAAHRERRTELLDDESFTARVREDDDRDVLVLYPDEWLDEGTLRRDRIEDLGRAVEVPLSGPGDPDDWDAVAAYNDAAVERVAERHGPVHEANAAAFADFMGNHLAKPVDAATPDEVRRFVEDYYPRNAWPSDEERAVVEESVELAVAAAESLDRDPPDA